MEHSRAATKTETWFRADVEGLRGIAILMVVLGHAGVPGFSGGFVGVDVFFVVSGFVITGLLLRELRQTSAIDYWGFYARRARRLLPAFAAMMLGTMAIVFLLPGPDQALQSRSGMWAALWSSNIFFSLADFGYFDASAKESAFLHTWSLGVEEQFYLLWPVLLAFVWKISGAHAARNVARVIAVVAVGGFLLALVATARWPVGAYYLMPFRLWELAVGGVCSIAAADIRATAARRLAWGGLVLLVLACTTISETRPYPGLWALLPVLGTASLILAGSDVSALVSRSLSSSVPTFLGRISYSWYLWHWPVLVLAWRTGYSGAIATAAAVMLSLALAVASYWGIERNTRHRPIANFRQAVVAGLLASILLALLPSTWRALSRGSAPQNVAIEQRILSMVSIPQIYAIQGCDEWYQGDRLVPCQFTSASGGSPRGTVVVIGDSAGLQWFPALADVFGKAGWNVVVLTKSSCPIVDEPYFYERIHRRFSECETWRKSAIAYVQAARPDMVVLGSAGSYPFTPQQWTEGSRRVIEQLRSGTARVLVLAPSPRLPFDGPGCVMGNAAIRAGNPVSEACVAPLSEIEDKAVIEALSQAAPGIDGVAVLSMNDLICPRGRCAAWVDDKLIYRDSQHLNASFVEALAPAMAKRIGPYMSVHAAPAAQ